jgi:rRNA maturation endonuclease Nob1
MNNDLISRSELKKAIIEHRYDYVEDNFFWTKLFDIIDNAPTVSDRTEEVLSLQNTIAKLVEGIAENARPQDKWGKWVISEIQCPNCLEYFQTDCYSTEELKKCPNCGAGIIEE